MGPWHRRVSGVACLHTTAQAGSYIVAVSPYGDATTAETHMRGLVRFAVEASEPGDEIIFLDGYNVKGLCRFFVPDKAAYAHPKAKLRTNGACVKALLAFGASRDADLPQGAMRLPQLLRHIGENYDMSRYDAVLLDGSPIYHDPREPRFSMKAARIPSDGHVIASRQESPFGMAGSQGLFKDTPVHFTSSGTGWQLNDKHGFLVERFWALSVEAVGGMLATFEQDRDITVRRLMTGAEAVGPRPVLSGNTKLEMTPLRIERFAGPPIHQRTLSSTPLAEAELRSAARVEVGIRWDGCDACDLDIYVQPYKGAETLFYGHTHSAEGTFFKDFRSRSALANGLESVAFHAPVELRRMLIAVNLYGGSAPNGASGELRIAVGDQTYGVPFSISATKGNRGVGREQLMNTRNAPNANWVVIDPLTVVARR